MGRGPTWQATDRPHPPSLLPRRSTPPGYPWPDVAAICVRASVPSQAAVYCIPPRAFGHLRMPAWRRPAVAVCRLTCQTPPPPASRRSSPFPSTAGPPVLALAPPPPGAHCFTCTCPRLPPRQPRGVRCHRAAAAAPLARLSPPPSAPLCTFFVYERGRWRRFPRHCRH